MRVKKFENLTQGSLKNILTAHKNYRKYIFLYPFKVWILINFVKIEKMEKLFYLNVHLIFNIDT